MFVKFVPNYIILINCIISKNTQYTNYLRYSLSNISYRNKFNITQHVNIHSKLSHIYEYNHIFTQYQLKNII